jgi:hypothetical protein
VNIRRGGLESASFPEARSAAIWAFGREDLEEG